MVDVNIHVYPQFQIKTMINDFTERSLFDNKYQYTCDISTVKQKININQIDLIITVIIPQQKQTCRVFGKLLVFDTVICYHFRWNDQS